MKPRAVALSVLSLFLFAIPALGNLVTAVSQVRTVSGFTTATDLDDDVTDSDSEASADYAPFVVGAAANAFVSDALGSGGGTQDSTVLGSTITAEGSCFANGEGYSFDGIGTGFGSSSFSYTFDLNA